MNFYQESKKVLKLISDSEEKGEISDKDAAYIESVIDDILKKANELYYRAGEESFLTDKEFDKLLNIRNEYFNNGELNLNPVVIKGTKVTHAQENLLGTIEKIQDSEELKPFFDDIIDKYPEDNKDYQILASIKIDGWSIAFDVVNNVIERAYSRGQDGEGEDYTKFFKGIKFENDIIESDEDTGETSRMPKKYTLKCEAAMVFKDFEEYNKIYNELNGKELANPRFAVGSILSNDDGKKFIKYLTFFPIQSTITDSRVNDFSIISDVDLMFNKNSGGIKFKAIPFAVFEYNEIQYSFWATYHSFNEEIKEPYDLLGFYQLATDLKINKNAFDFMCDGIVYEILNKDIREELGYGQTDGKATPNFAVALKFPITKVKTKIKDFEWDVAYSLSGKITPCVRIEPKLIDGRTFDRVSLSYLDRIIKEDFRIGEEVYLEIRGDVLGYISKNPDFDNSKLEGAEIITECPICGHELNRTKSKDDIESLSCPNPDCPNKRIGKFINYFNMMRIKGVDVSTVQTMIEHKLIEKIEDLYIFDISKLANCEGFGKKSAENVYKAIQARSNVYDYEFLGAWNWKGIGRERMKQLLQKVDYNVLFSNYKKLIRKDFIQWISEFEGFSNIMAGNLHDGLNEDYDEIIYIISKKFVTIQSSKQDFGKDFKSYKIVVTGDLHHWKEREDFKKQIELMGHKMIGSISGKTDYLVTNTPNSGTVKNKKAKELGIPVVTEEEIIKILGIEI